VDYFIDFAYEALHERLQTILNNIGAATGLVFA
jgi:hypothetical protein